MAKDKMLGLRLPQIDRDRLEFLARARGSNPHTVARELLADRIRTAIKAEMDREPKGKAE